MASVDIVDGYVDAATLKIHASKTLEVLEADESLHRPPELLVDNICSGRKQHENEIAEQIRLCKVYARRVKGLEDSVGVVSVDGRDVDSGEPLHDHTCEALKVKRFVVRTEKLDVASKEPVCLPDTILAASVSTALYARVERRPVGLSRDEPEPGLAVLKFVDEIELVISLDCSVVVPRGRVANRGEDQHQGGQPLLAVNDEVRRDATPGV